MKKYFTYLLKKNLIPLACFTLLFLLAYVVPIATNSYSYWNTNQDYEYYHATYIYDGNLLAVLGLLSVFIPIYLLSYKMNKRSVDMHYSLPLSKTKILVANYLTGLVLLYASYTVTYLIGFVAIALKVRRLHLIYYLYLYLASIIPAFILYTFTAFIFTRANTVIDGIISVVGAMCVLALAVAAFNEVIYTSSWYTRGIKGYDFFAFAPLIHVGNFFDNAIKYGSGDIWFNTYTIYPDDPVYSNHLYQRELAASVCQLVGDVLWFMIAIAATVGLFSSEKNSKAENCGQVSESAFCYKTQLPIYAALFTIMFLAISGDVWVTLLALVFGIYVLSIIYKRTVKIGWKHAVVLGSCIVGAMILYVIIDAICDATYSYEQAQVIFNSFYKWLM